MDDLLKQAEELGIKVDKRWSEGRLQKEIDAALAGETKENDVAETLFPVKLQKNYRPVGGFKIVEKDGERAPTGEEEAKVSAGTVILVGVEEAKRIIGLKIAERADAIG